MASVNKMNLGEWKLKRMHIPYYIIKLKGSNLVLGDIYCLNQKGEWTIEAGFGKSLKETRKVTLPVENLEYCKKIWEDLMNHYVLPKIFKEI